MNLYSEFRVRITLFSISLTHSPPAAPVPPSSPLSVWAPEALQAFRDTLHKKHTHGSLLLFWERLLSAHVPLQTHRAIPLPPPHLKKPSHSAVLWISNLSLLTNYICTNLFGDFNVKKYGQ